MNNPNYNLCMEALLFQLKDRFGWKVGKGFSEKELEGLIQTGDEIASAIERWLPGVNGDSWVRKNLGNTVFHKGGLPQRVVSIANGGQRISLVFVNHHVWLDPSTFNSVHPAHWICHELGHVLDNNFHWMAVWWGGGPSDDLMRFMYVQPSGLRWCNGKSLAKKMPVEVSWTFHNQGRSPLYGDNSSADYFAETWTWSIFRPNLVPPAAKAWFTDWMRDQSLTIVDR